MKSLFEQIDALKPIIPEDEMNKTNALRQHIWTKDHPDEWKRIVKKQNDKRSVKREMKQGGAHGNQAQGGCLVSAAAGRVCDR